MGLLIMHTSSFRTIVLPGLLASGAVFFALTLPGASTQVSRVTTQLPVQIQRWIALAGGVEEQKGLSIRYIGAAILSSTAVGIGTAEGLRRKQVHDHQQQKLLQQALEAPDSDSIFDQDENGTTWSGVSSSVMATSVAPSPTDLSWDTTAAEALSSVQEESATVTSPLDWNALHRDFQENLEDQVSATPTPGTLLPEGVYLTQRIRTKNDQSLTAICVEGEFYSFYRLSKQLTNTQKWLDRLHRDGKHAVATPEQDGYAIWLHQPDAQLEPSTWQPEIHLSQGFSLQTINLAYGDLG